MNKNIFVITSLIGCFSICMPLQTNADTVGRLFFSPSERAAMNRLRANGFVEAPVEQSTSFKTEPKSPSQLNGYVKRSNGTTAVWIDGKAHYESTGEMKLNPSVVETPSRIIIKRSETPQPKPER